MSFRVYFWFCCCISPSLVLFPSLHLSSSLHLSFSLPPLISFLLSLLQSHFLSLLTVSGYSEYKDEKTMSTIIFVVIAFVQILGGVFIVGIWQPETLAKRRYSPYTMLLSPNSHLLLSIYYATQSRLRSLCHLMPSHTHTHTHIHTHTHTSPLSPLPSPLSPILSPLSL